MSQLFVSGSNRIGVSVLAPFLSMNIQGWFPLWLTDLITLLSKGFSRVFFSNTVQKHELFVDQTSLWCNSHNHTLSTEKQHSSDAQIFAGKVMSLLFNILSRFVIVILPRSKCLLIWLQLLCTLILEPKKNVWHYLHFFPIYLPWSDGTRCHDLCFLNVEF